MRMEELNGWAETPRCGCCARKYAETAGWANTVLALRCAGCWEDLVCPRCHLAGECGEPRGALVVAVEPSQVHVGDWLLWLVPESLSLGETVFDHRSAVRIAMSVPFAEAKPQPLDRIDLDLTHGANGRSTVQLQTALRTRARVLEARFTDQPIEGLARPAKDLIAAWAAQGVSRGC